jgi:DNA-binding NtrC family response regulator
MCSVATTNGKGSEPETRGDFTWDKAVIFNDPKSQQLLEQINRVALADAPILIIGETGTGKELLARHVHARSEREGPFVAVNCGAVTQSLAEAELFGHQAGSFTGATESRAGWFEAANGGTLFLDEIGDLPHALQVKLLRVLQEREVVRVGSRKPIAIDVRLVAATNVDLPAAIAAGRFRADLFYRLNVITMNLPPLRERPGDVLPLTRHFVSVYSRRLNVNPPTLAPEAARTLQQHPWPGNVRELENVVHAAVLLAPDCEIQSQDLRFTNLPGAFGAAANAGPLDLISTQLQRLFYEPPSNLHRRLEELTVRRAFVFCGHNQVHTAKLLGMSRNVLRKLLKRFGLIHLQADATTRLRQIELNRIDCGN